MNLLVQERWQATAQAEGAYLISMPDPAPELRRTLRARRRALSKHTQRRHSRQAAQAYKGSTLFLRYQRIAAYLANDGELDPSPIIEAAFGAGKQLFLPVLRHRPSKSLWFSEYRRGDRLLINHFAIPEPDIRARPPVPPWGLDVILMPLVGFDQRGQRIGMGGGFYDRTLDYLPLRQFWRRPLLIGLAHECQAWPLLPTRPWDVPLDGVLTENGLQTFNRHAP